MAELAGKLDIQIAVVATEAFHDFVRQQFLTGSKFSDVARISISLMLFLLCRQKHLWPGCTGRERLDSAIWLGTFEKTLASEISCAIRGRYPVSNLFTRNSPILLTW
jgi:hypothetical protein